ncbi:hypothetical protein BD779DRAFT_1671792 [Infundibulicybe gibba]|nr:hypothetical protein BD779DRAFT_1671792 [Infundibulicybe gibba]
MPPSTFAEAWGSVFVCLLVSSALNGGIAIQACSYFSRFKNDMLVLKCAVVVVCLGAVLHFACTSWILHSVVILGYDRSVYDVIIPLGLPIGSAVEAIVHSTVQGIYLFRMYRFGQNRYILASCCVLVLLQLGLGLTWVGRLSTGKPFLLIFARDQETKWIVTSFFTISAAVDVFIAVSLSYQLMQSRKGSLKRTKYLVDKIMRWTICEQHFARSRVFDVEASIATGMLTSAVAITIVFAVSPKYNFTSQTPRQFKDFPSGICGTPYFGSRYACSNKIVNAPDPNDARAYISPIGNAFCLLALLNARRKHINTTDLSMVDIPTMSGHVDGSSSSWGAVAAEAHDLDTPPRKV